MYGQVSWRLPFQHSYDLADTVVGQTDKAYQPLETSVGGPGDLSGASPALPVHFSSPPCSSQVQPQPGCHSGDSSLQSMA